MRALVTGAGGFAGQWLCKLLISDGWDVHGATLTGAPALGTLEGWQRNAVLWQDADLRDPADVEKAIDSAKPDAIFHLAAVSFVPDAGADAAVAWDTNVAATKHLLTAVATRRAAGTLDPVVVVVGSGEQYGLHAAEDLPLKEDAALLGESVYAKTKIAQEEAALAMWRETGMRIVAARPFNHSGVGQSTSFVIPAIVERARDAQEHNRKFIRIGNPDPVRDFLDARDVVRAYVHLAMRGVPGEVYNVASGEGVSVRRLAEMVLETMRYDADIRVDPELARPVDIPALVGSAAKLNARTGWKPDYDLEMVIEDIVYGESD